MTKFEQLKEILKALDTDFIELSDKEIAIPCPLGIMVGKDEPIKEPEYQNDFSIQTDFAYIHITDCKENLSWLAMDYDACWLYNDDEN